jgi:large subunit ribosomal protein L3
VAQVVQEKREEKEGYAALQLGCGSKRPKQVNKTQIGHFSAAGVPIKRKMQEFRISPVRHRVPALHPKL